ncbi:cardiolipin synthase [Fusibacter sp. 3D3]|uniref:cardiolipin synthase n=1 Tax=Fusibacter sp. 3D3 TaxID=1048380 RepID=UPI000855C525|nr:cardiolipin synthase [Fusibacter sp. 3D3]GAU76134.1 cardiolipin synthetase [Fusibacter sp. 3D3]
MERLIRRVLIILLTLLVTGSLWLGYYWLAQHANQNRYIEIAFNTIYWLFRINILWIAIVIFLENKNPSRTVAWLLVLTLIPLLGFLCYILFGRSYRKKSLSKSKHLSDSDRLSHAAKVQQGLIDYIDLPNSKNAHNKRLMQLLLTNAKAPFSLNNEINVLTNGMSKFSRLVGCIERAKAHIHIEYFIIKDDQIGNDIRRLLIEKAKKGVKVRIIYDAVGSFRLSKYYIESLKKAGVEVYPFFPVAFPLFSRDLNYRNHRKIVVVDGTVGFVGGLNIGDEYLGKSDRFDFWRDTHLEIKGEAVYALQTIFLNDWNYVAKQLIDGADYFPEHAIHKQALMQVVASGPDSEWQAILQAFYKMMASATDKIWITTPYLVPEESLMMGLKTAALSGVDVRIIIPSQPDHFFVYWASQSNIETLLEAGVKIYQYKNGFIHSKIMIVDRLSATVGTTNLDIRSLEINFEVNAFIYDVPTIIRLEEDFVKDLTECNEFIWDHFKKRPFTNKVLEALGRLVSPLQ